jgi:hypothetical protein
VSKLLTKADVIEKIVAHFSKPDAQFAAIYDDVEQKVMCVYRGNNDPESPVRCAMGVCIPDHLYDALMESKCASAVIAPINGVVRTRSAVGALFAPDVDMPRFLDACQAAHDDFAESALREGEAGDTVKDFLYKLGIVASDYGVPWPVKP